MTHPIKSSKRDVALVCLEIWTHCFYRRFTQSFVSSEMAHKWIEAPLFVPCVLVTRKLCVFVLDSVYVWWPVAADGVWEGWCNIFSSLQLCFCVYIQIFKPTHILATEHHPLHCWALVASHSPTVSFDFYNQLSSIYITTYFLCFLSKDCFSY